MKNIIAVALVLSLTSAYADEKKPEAKKPAKPAAKSEKNAAQKAEQSVYKWSRDNKIWIQSK